MRGLTPYTPGGRAWHFAKANVIPVKKLRWLISIFVIYLVSYSVLVDLHEPSINDSGEFVFRSSFRKFSKTGFRLEVITWTFPEVSLANWFYLPIDQLWRFSRGLPPSIFEKDELNWDAYFDYLIANRSMKRSERPISPTRLKELNPKPN
jgi:hypothetical protein